MNQRADYPGGCKRPRLRHALLKHFPRLIEGAPSPVVAKLANAEMECLAVRGHRLLAQGLTERARAGGVPFEAGGALEGKPSLVFRSRSATAGR